MTYYRRPKYVPLAKDPADIARVEVTVPFRRVYTVRLAGITVNVYRERFSHDGYAAGRNGLPPAGRYTALRRYVQLNSNDV